MSGNQYARLNLPEHFAPVDQSWIQQQLSMLPPGIRANIAARYSAAWDEAYDAEPISFKRENAARRAANIRLRECVKNYSASWGGTVLPPTAQK